MSEDDFAYKKLIAALEGISKGKGPNDDVSPDGVRPFKIIDILRSSGGIGGVLHAEHMDFATAALKAWGDDDASDDIAGIVKALLGKAPAT